MECGREVVREDPIFKQLGATRVFGMRLFFMSLLFWKYKKVKVGSGWVLWRK